MIKRIHHINFIVRDLNKALATYRILYGDPVAGQELLPQRGVKLARFKIGETWLILVQPLTQEGVVAKHLEEHGEGFFLMSCQVDDVITTAEQVSDEGIRVLDQQPRQGLDDWRVMDLDSADLFGANIQLVESST